MPKKGQVLDLTGHSYGKWSVLSHCGQDKQGGIWLCRCACGTERGVRSRHLRNGASQSCGCSRPVGDRHPSFEHGMSESAEFKTWLQMHTRCYNPNYSEWEHYGARGITICGVWKSDFMAFYRDLGPKPSVKHSIERADINKGYEPGNCRWATPVEQARNTSRTAWVILDGRMVSLAEACETTGTKYASAQERRAAGKDWRG